MCPTPPLSHFCFEERNSVDCWVPTPGIMLGTPEGLSKCRWANEWSERKRVDSVSDSLVRAASWGMSQHRSSWVIYSLQVWEIHTEYSFPLFFILPNTLQVHFYSFLTSHGTLGKVIWGLPALSKRDVSSPWSPDTDDSVCGGLPLGVCSGHGTHIETRPKAKQK